MPLLATDSRIVSEARALLEPVFELRAPLLEDSPERRAVLTQVDALVLGTGWFIREPEFVAAPKLRVIGRPGVGLDNIDLASATRHGVCVINTPDAPSQSTAEHAVTLIVGLAKGLVRSERGLRERGWESRAEFLGLELKGKTLGLVGVGRIGGLVAQTCRDGLRMKVLAYDPFIDPARADALGVELTPDLNTLLARSDFVSLHCALSPKTKGLIGAAELAAMKPTAFLINCARGPIVDEAALAEALRSRKIAGAGLDVFAQEPLAADHPFRALDNLVLTPHVASHTAECEIAMHVGCAEDVLRVWRGEKPKALVNVDVWDKRRK